MSLRPGGSWGGQEGIGLAIGRASSHEAITHNFLMRGNGRTLDSFGHSQSGITKPEFGVDLFSKDAANQFLIPPALNAELWQSYGFGSIPDNQV